VEVQITLSSHKQTIIKLELRNKSPMTIYLQKTIYAERSNLTDKVSKFGPLASWPQEDLFMTVKYKVLNPKVLPKF